MCDRGLIAPHTDADLVATNDRYGGRWHTSSNGLAPASWSDAGTDALIYLAVGVICFGSTVIVYAMGWL